MCHIKAVKLSYFYTRLTKEETGYDYSRVRTWTRNSPLVDADIILVPINRNQRHW